jgi:hypothetical protein
MRDEAWRGRYWEGECQFDFLRYVVVMSYLSVSLAVGAPGWEEDVEDDHVYGQRDGYGHEDRQEDGL